MIGKDNNNTVVMHQARLWLLRHDIHYDQLNPMQQKEITDIVNKAPLHNDEKNETALEALRRYFDNEISQTAFYQAKHPRAQTARLHSSTQGIIEKIEKQESLQGVWVTDTDIKAALSSYNLFNKPIDRKGKYILPPFRMTDKTFQEKVSEVLRQSRNTDGVVDLIIPTDFNGSHWCVSHLEIRQGEILKAQLIDSMRSTSDFNKQCFADNIKALAASAKTEPKIQFIEQGVQHDSLTCGYHAIANCAQIVADVAHTPEKLKQISRIDRTKGPAELCEKTVRLIAENKHLVLSDRSLAFVVNRPVDSGTIMKVHDSDKYLSNLQEKNKEFVKELAKNNVSETEVTKLLKDDLQKDELLARLLQEQYLSGEGDDHKAFARAQAQLKSMNLGHLQTFFQVSVNQVKDHTVEKSENIKSQ